MIFNELEPTEYAEKSRVKWIKAIIWYTDKTSSNVREAAHIIFIYVENPRKVKLFC